MHLTYDFQSTSVLRQKIKEKWVKYKRVLHKYWILQDLSITLKGNSSWSTYHFFAMLRKWWWFSLILFYNSYLILNSFVCSTESAWISVLVPMVCLVASMLRDRWLHGSDEDMVTSCHANDLCKVNHLELFGRSICFSQ